MTDLEKILGITAPAADQLEAIEAQVKKALMLMRQLDEIESLAKQVKSDLLFITERTLPDVMAAAGVSEFTTTEGVKVSIKDIVRGSLPKDDAKRECALNWLINNGAADLIKEHVDLEFGRGQHNEAAMVKSELDKLGQSYTSKEDVHHTTLAAFARERMKAGEPVPLDLLGLYAGRAAKINIKDTEK